MRNYLNDGRKNGCAQSRVLTMQAVCTSARLMFDVDAAGQDIVFVCASEGIV